MPELPEVETVRKELEKHVVGETISKVLTSSSGVLKGQIETIINTKIIEVRRLSKLLLINTSGKFSIAVHLKMTGRLILFDPSNPSSKNSWEYDYVTNPHTHVTVVFHSGKILFFNDYRRFGTVEIVETGKLPELPYVKSLGKEFFRDLTLEDFMSIIVRSGRAIKTLLLDQSVVAGVGNIYANEALWEAHIHPEQPGKTLTMEQRERLFHATELVMRQSLEYAGASSDNFRDLFGRKGTAQDHFTLYGKEGKPCPRCGNLIKKYFLGGRGTYVCEICQKKV